MLVGLLFYALRSATSGPGGANKIFSFGKAKFKKVHKDGEVKVTFADVAGLDEAKSSET